MVDPNRKINRLTDKDIEFLDECEEEFANRFTNEDSEFVDHCSKPISRPPVVQNWCENRQFNRNLHHSGNYRSNRRWGNNNHRRPEYERDRYNSRNNWHNSR